MVPFCPVMPTEKQQSFLDREELEVFYGGAAGGGKSVALLMGALQYVDRPGYAALILRKDLPRLCLPGGLIPRSHEWLAGTDAKWNQARHEWRFPVEDGPPATITFGYLARPLDKYRYASSEFQYIAFDELTDFSLDDYLFLFSRLRKVRTIDVPLRMRSASNPGGLGHAWVKERFVGREPAMNIVERDGRVYIPARIADNPALDEAEYCRSLMHLPALARERLMNGDWSVEEQALFHAEHLRYYVETASQMELLDPRGVVFQQVEEGSCHRLITIDPAGTAADYTAEAKGRGASFSVLQVWDRPPRELSRFLILRHQVRVRVAFADLCAMIVTAAAQWRPDRIGIEGEKLGKAAADQLKRQLTVECLPTRGQDKVTRAGKLLIKFQRGEIFLPKHETTWRPGLEAEFLAWTGNERQASDQIDAAAYAAILAEDGLPHAIRMERLIMPG